MTPKKALLFYSILALLFSGQVSGQEIDVRKLTLNTTENSEMAPMLQDSVFYFVSNRRTNILVTYMDQHEELLYSIFRAPLKSDGTMGTPRRFAPPQQPRFSAGPLTFSANGATMIATHNQRNKSRRKSGQIPLSLYQAHKKNEAWINYEPLKLDMPDGASIGHPSLSPDGRLLFFVSDMEGGHGQTDIYVARKRAGKWGKPQNLGPQINTPGKELFPFIHSSGKLYFTSNGHGGPGGFSILYAEWDAPEIAPVLLPAPINSRSNDFSCFIADNEKWGFFASDRSGNDDIYEFRLPEIKCASPQEVKADNYCFTFFEDGAGQSDTLPQIYRWDFGDGTTATGLEVDHCFEGPGQYNVTLNVVDTLVNEELSSVASYNLNLTPKKQIWFDLKDTVRVDEKFRISAEFRGFENIPDNPVFFWNFDNGETRIGKNIAYIYNKPGQYKVVCSAKLSSGQTVCFYREIIVSDP